MLDIKSITIQELEDIIIGMNQPKFRANQLFRWLHRGVASFDEMTDMPKAFRTSLTETCEIKCAEIVKEVRSALDSTRKYLVKFNDRQFAEAVLMEYRHGFSVCISTQVGCKMGCTFCATGQEGFFRNLTASEMLAQITAIAIHNKIRISNVVLMGMGEPLDNFDHVMRFLELLSHPDGICIGQRHVSLSTCGIVDKIEQLIDMKPQFTLSVSLHAPNDQIRGRTMPVNKKWGVDCLLSVCRRYGAATGRRISFEYALISGENDSDECAAQLAAKLKGMLCHVNLIPVNSSPSAGYKKPDKTRIKAFCDRLNNQGINTTVRRTLGADINASCGQLRSMHNSRCIIHN